MSRGLPETHPLHRLFRGLAETTFHGELGIADPELVGYVADLLVRFTPTAGLWRRPDRGGGRLPGVAALVAEAESASDEAARREGHRHVGDFALFWRGVYPETVSRLGPADSADRLLDFAEWGKRSYHLASRIGGEGSAILRRLGDEFDLCAAGLQMVRREWERPDPVRGDGPVILV